MRIFKIGTTEIKETDNMAALTIPEIQARLAATYPEAATATIRESKRGDDQLVELIARAGVKG